MNFTTNIKEFSEQLAKNKNDIFIKKIRIIVNWHDGLEKLNKLIVNHKKMKVKQFLSNVISGHKRKKLEKFNKIYHKQISYALHKIQDHKNFIGYLEYFQKPIMNISNLFNKVKIRNFLFAYNIIKEMNNEKKIFENEEQKTNIIFANENIIDENIKKINGLELFYNKECTYMMVVKNQNLFLMVLLS